MASRPKKQKLSKREKKKIMSEKGKKSAESRGKGVLSREEFELPAKWERDIRQGETREIVDYYSPGKTKVFYADRSQKSASSERNEVVL